MLIDNDSIVYVGYFYGESTVIEDESIVGSSDFPVEFIAKKAVYQTYIQGRSASEIDTNFSKQNNKYIAIQPNPFSDIIHISFGNLEVSNIDMVNHLGQIIYVNNDISEDNLSVNMSNLKNNMYFVRCYDKDGLLLDVQKIIKL